MDAERFEDLSRRLAAVPSRRAALATLAAAAAAAVGMGRAPEAEAGIPIVNCKVPGKKCDKDQKCCTGRCVHGRCRCAKKGHTCWAPLEGALCCSGRCKNAKCQ